MPKKKANQMDPVNKTQVVNASKRKKYEQRIILPKIFFSMTAILLLTLTQIFLRAQEISHAMVFEYDNRFHKAIGVDENLINGYQYINQYPKMSGHAFLGSNEFVPGKLIINNKTYTDIPVKYDIRNQDVIISYINSFGNVNELVLQKNFITEFDIKDKHFKKFSFPETGTQFFQVISNNRIPCLYFWEKTLTVSSSSLASYYEYSDQNKKTYLVINSHLRQYKGKHSFIKLFPDEMQSPIKKYMKSHKINIKSATDRSVKELIEFCENQKMEGSSL
jgi:hypothetical protein